MTTRTEWRIDLPFTTPPLTENMRLHWAKKARLTKQLRDDTHLLAKVARLPRGLDFAVITFHWAPGTNRGRDENAPSPSLKACVDGLTDYGLTADDTTAHVKPGCCVHDWQRGVPAACWLTIETRPE